MGARLRSDERSTSSFWIATLTVLASKIVATGRESFKVEPPGLVVQPVSMRAKQIDDSDLTGDLNFNCSTLTGSAFVDELEYYCPVLRGVCVCSCVVTERISAGISVLLKNRRIGW